MMASDQIRLIQGGKPHAAVVLQVDDPLRNPAGGLPAAESTLEQAAEDLVGYAHEITGATLPIHRVSASQLEGKIRELKDQGQIAVILGSPAHEAVDQTNDAVSNALADPSGFVRQVDPTHVLIAGRTPSAVAFGVHDLLERNGVRWFFPGPQGTVIPRAPDFIAETGIHAERPSLAARHYQLKNSDEWIRHQRAGGLYFPSAHGIPLGQDANIEKFPHLYALVKGERSSRQLCLSNPDVLNRAIDETKKYFREHPAEPWIGLGPNDGGGFCECAGCQAMDGGDNDPFSGGISVTDRYMDFFNQVLHGIHEEFPDKQIAFYIYHNYMRPPVRVKPDSRIAGAIAPISLCRIHGMNNPICPERSYLKSLIDAWSEILPNLYERGYWYNLADPGMMFIQTHRLRDEIPYYARKGVKGYRTECMGHWALHGPSLYLAGKLMWNAEANADDIVKDYCAKLFGPAARDMEEYFQFLDTRLETADHHTGGALNILQIYPKTVRETAERHLKAAEAKATASPWKERVAIFSQGFVYFQAFAEMIEAEQRQDWLEAHACMQRMDRASEDLAQDSHPLLAGKSAQSHFDRFFRPCVEQGYARVTEGNRLLAPLSSDWDFLIDPQAIGEDMGYARPEITGGNWQKVSALLPWSDIGLRYYKGLAWYRQRITLPESVAGQRVFLWFGGADETARVWVNGRLIGNGPVSAFTPFELDATDAVKPGENVITVCVANLRVNELGSGGITSPAFFYLPKLGPQAVLENLKPLRETFP